MKLVAFCEAPSDFQITSHLVDRVLREEGPSWVADVLDASAFGIREWTPDGLGRTYFDLHKHEEYEELHAVRVPHGHFEGSPGAAGALMARTVFWIVRRLIKSGIEIDAVVLVWDMDDQPRERQAGLAQARAEAQTWASFRIAIGCPNAMREAWVLSGFEPSDQGERERFNELRQDLGCAPNAETHLLNSNDEQAKRSPKRVLRLLSLGDRDREELCWAQTPLETLKMRGVGNGLSDFLGELSRELLPLCHGA